MRWARVAMMLLAAATGVARAQAEPAPPAFGWVGADCADAAPLFEQRLEELTAPLERARLSGSVAVTRRAERYEVALSLDLDGRVLGTRRFDAGSCARAAETAAVAASLAVYDGASEPPGAAASGVSPDIWTRRSDPIPDFSRPSPPPEQTEPPLLRGRLGLLGQLGVGALPAADWGGALTVELGVGPRWSFAALGSLSREQRRELDPAQSVFLSTTSAAARACVAPVWDLRYRLDACVGGRWTRNSGRGEGFDVNRSASLDWVGPLFGAAFSVQAPAAVEWRAELEGALPLARRRFMVDDREISRPAAVVTTLRLGALLRLW